MMAIPTATDWIHVNPLPTLVISPLVSPDKSHNFVKYSNDQIGFIVNIAMIGVKKKHLLYRILNVIPATVCNTIVGWAINQLTRVHQLVSSCIPISFSCGWGYKLLVSEEVRGPLISQMLPRKALGILAALGYDIILYPLAIEDSEREH